MVFIINNVDFSGNIIAGTYEVNDTDIFVSWKDGNYTQHRKRVSSKVSGSLKMFFRTVEEYNDFLNALNSTKRDNMTHLITLMVNNSNRIKSCDMFIDYSLIRNIDGGWHDYFEAFELKLEEA